MAETIHDVIAEIEKLHALQRSFVKCARSHRDRGDESKDDGAIADTWEIAAASLANHLKRAKLADRLAVLWSASRTGSSISEDAWQPIETAPKDGTAILAYDDERAAIIYWKADKRYVVGGCWNVDDGVHVMPGPRGWQPSPLPTPPLSETPDTTA